MTQVALPPLAEQMVSLVRQVIGEIRPQLVEAATTHSAGERDNPRHAGNFLSKHDLWMHRRYKELLTVALGSFVYASEEGDPEIVGTEANPDLYVLVDPLDTSELAVRGLCGYTHLLVYSRSLHRPIASVVGDIFHHFQLYVGARTDAGSDHAWLITADAQRFLLAPRARSLPEALLTNYSMRPAERFEPLAQQGKLLRSVKRIGVDFGSIGLCHVAAGFTDAMVEFAKGFAIWDLLPGQYILDSAGGVVLDLDGNSLSLDFALHSPKDMASLMNGRQKFIAASSLDLARGLLAQLS